MGSSTGQTKRLESVLSVLLLGLLVVIGVGVFIKQFDSDMARFGIVTGQAPSSQKTGANEQQVLASVLPAGFEATFAGT